MLRSGELEVKTKSNHDEQCGIGSTISDELNRLNGSGGHRPNFW
jgi:hypothetical protein